MLNNNRYINLLLVGFFITMMGFVLFANKMFRDYETQQLNLEKENTSYSIEME